MRKKIALACWMFVAAAAARHGAQGANIADFIDYTLRDAGGRVLLPGRLFVPPQASSGENMSRPLLVGLPGAGVAGTDNVTQVALTPDFVVDEAKRRGAFLYLPQTPSTWSNVAVDRAMTMIDRAVAEQNVDASRLYAMGYSDGGGGTWNLLNRNRNRFAAAMTVSAVAPSSGFLASNLLGTPIFALHARDDDTIAAVSRTRTVVSGILSAAGEPAPNYALAGAGKSFLVSNPQFEFHQALVSSQAPGSAVNYFISGHDLDLMYLETPNGGHSGTLGAFTSPFTYEWMFSHSRAVPEPATLTLLMMAMIVHCARRRSTVS